MSVVSSMRYKSKFASRFVYSFNLKFYLRHTATFSILPQYNRSYIEMDIFRTIYNADTQTWHGKNLPLMYHKNVSIAQIVLTSFNRYPNRVVQISDNNEMEITTDQLKIRSIRTALHLSKLNLTNDDCIGIIAMNNHHLAPIVIGALLIGVPIHPIDPLFDNGDIAHIFNLSKPAIIFCDDNLIDRVRFAVGTIGLQPKFVSFNQKLEDIEYVEDYFKPIDGEAEFIPVQIENGEKAIALIMCSSGTTGLSKAVCLSHAQITHKFTTFWTLTCDDVYLCYSTIYWITGIISLLIGSIICCKRIITTRRFTSELFLEIVEKYRVTQVLSPPSYLGQVLQHPDIHLSDVSSIKLFICVGGRVPEEFIIKSRKIFKNGISQCYGMTEVGGIVSFNCGDVSTKSVGYLSHNLEAKIIDDAGKNLGVNQNGEVIMRSAFNFVGYKGDPELTKVVLNSNGWVHSGDLGYFDETGRLFLIDRKKDLLKYCGFQISPAEIEEFLLKQKFIQNVCIVGIPDRLSGDLPTAVVILKSDVIYDDRLVKKLINNSMKENMADYKFLRGGVYIVDRFPMTPSGKIKKRLVQKMVLDLYNLKPK